MLVSQEQISQAWAKINNALGIATPVSLQEAAALYEKYISFGQRSTVSVDKLYTQSDLDLFNLLNNQSAVFDAFSTLALAQSQRAQV